jgi:HSP20 family protein
MTQMTRSTPNRSAPRGRDDLERWLSAWMPGQAWDATFADSNWLPPVNIAEDQDSYLIEAELPGVKREDIKVTYNNGVLTIQGERKEEKEEKGQQYHRMERVYGQFERSFRLPLTVKADQIQAEYNNGVLTLRVPKAEEAKPRQISINVQEGTSQQAGKGHNGGQANASQQGSAGQQGASATKTAQASESATWGNQEQEKDSGSTPKSKR